MSLSDCHDFPPLFLYIYIFLFVRRPSSINFCLLVCLVSLCLYVCVCVSPIFQSLSLCIIASYSTSLYSIFIPTPLQSKCMCEHTVCTCFVNIPDIKKILPPRTVKLRLALRSIRPSNIASHANGTLLCSGFTWNRKCYVSSY